MRYFSTRKRYSKRKNRHRIANAFIGLLRVFFPKHRVIYTHGEPEGPAIFCCNHERAYGPVAVKTQLPRRFRIWVIWSMCFYKPAAEHMRAEFWKADTAIGRAALNVLCHLTAPLMVGLMSGIEAIPVYYDIRVAETFTKSIQTLDEGLDIVIFPENSQPYYAYDHHFSKGFVQIAYRYYRKTGRCLSFYPMYACSRERTITVGKPMVYDPALSYKENEDAIGGYICREMMSIAKGVMSKYETLEEAKRRIPIDHD